MRDRGSAFVQLNEKCPTTPITSGSAISLFAPHGLPSGLCWSSSGSKSQFHAVDTGPDTSRLSTASWAPASRRCRVGLVAGQRRHKAYLDQVSSLSKAGEENKIAVKKRGKKKGFMAGPDRLIRPFRTLDASQHHFDDLFQVSNPPIFEKKPEMFRSLSCGYIASSACDCHHLDRIVLLNSRTFRDHLDAFYAVLLKSTNTPCRRPGDFSDGRCLPPRSKPWPT